MSIVTISSDINLEIFKYLKLDDLISLYKTNKTLVQDIEKYCKNIYKKTFHQVIDDYKCIHCNNICENENFKICDNCTCDTCWNCFNKVGSEYMCLKFDKDENDRYYPYYGCINKCMYKCDKCKKSYNKKNVIINKCKIVCLNCF